MYPSVAMRRSFTECGRGWVNAGDQQSDRTNVRLYSQHGLQPRSVSGLCTCGDGSGVLHSLRCSSWVCCRGLHNGRHWGDHVLVQVCSRHQAPIPTTRPYSMPCQRHSTPTHESAVAASAWSTRIDPRAGAWRPHLGPPKGRQSGRPSVRAQFSQLFNLGRKDLEVHDSILRSTECAVESGCCGELRAGLVRTNLIIGEITLFASGPDL